MVLTFTFFRLPFLFGAKFIPVFLFFVGWISAMTITVFPDIAVATDFSITSISSVVATGFGVLSSVGDPAWSAINPPLLQGLTVQLEVLLCSSIGQYRLAPGGVLPGMKVGWAVRKSPWLVGSGS